MTTRYSTALSHVFLAGTGLYCYLCAKGVSTVFAAGSFGCLILNSIIGIWRWGNPIYGPGTNKLYELTNLLQDSLVLPSVISSVWLQYGYFPEVAYVFIAASVLPIFMELTNVLKSQIGGKRSPVNQGSIHSTGLRDTVVGARCLMLGLLGFLHQNYFAVASSVSYAFNHFVIRETFFNVTSRDLYNYAMCFFAVFSLRTVLY